jgi:hypothetical protein
VTYGQDWSSFQSTNMPTAGLGFAVVKWTEGLTYTNPNAAAQVAHARANGLVVGHYHYPHMANSATAEAARFLKVAKTQPGDFLVLDWEGYDDANKGVPFSKQVAYKKAWLAHVQSAVAHMQTGTYANTDYLNRDPSGVYGDFLWIATADRPAGQPGISHKWLFHQYGASGVDRDYCPLTLAELKAWAHSKEDDMTPAQAATLNEILNLLKGPGNMAYRNEQQDAASVKAGHGHIPDVYGYLQRTDAGVQKLVAQNAALAAAVTALGKNGGLTAEQITAAAQAGADAALAELGHALDGANPTT